MSKRMIKYKRELESLATSQPSTARLLLKHKPASFIRAIVDATWTTLKGKLKLSPTDLSIVRSVQPALRRIASRGQTIEERRRKLLTRGGVKAVQKLFGVIISHF